MLYHCADERNAMLARRLLEPDFRYHREVASANEIPAEQGYKTDLDEVLGVASGVSDCRRVWPSSHLHPVWVANEIATFARVEAGQPAITKWLPYDQVLKFHHLTDEGYLVRPYGFWPGLYQVIIDHLRADPESKRCVFTFQEPDFIRPAPETPCALTMQFLLRSGRLWTINTYRSHDFFAGNITDPIRASVVQQAIAYELGVKPGPIIFQDGSLHYYPLRKHRPLLEVSSQGCNGDASLLSCETTSVAQLLEFAEAFQNGPEVNGTVTDHELARVLGRAVLWWLERQAHVDERAQGKPPHPEVQP